MELFGLDGRSEWIRLRTLALVRWIALTGQSVAVVVAVMVLGLTLPLGPIMTVMATLLLVNITSAMLTPGNSRLTPAIALGLMLFDLGQLAALLALTGGLSNPFVMLMMAPVAIGSTMLTRRGVVALIVVALALVSLLWVAYIPLRAPNGAKMELPDLFRFGIWTAVEIGIVFLALYARRVMSEMHAMGDALVATQTALAREQKLTDIGGVVAAAAHELGTPLGTIALAASELAEILEDRPDLAEDAELIRDQARRCKDILHSMGRAGKDDTLLRQAAARAIVEEAAAPHRDRGIAITLIAKPEQANIPEPEIPRAPEIIHGLRNLIQNAVDFAISEVSVDVLWSAEKLTVRVADDGPGYPPGMIEHLGDPLLSRHRLSSDSSQEGMGLGVFIAKTLLERTGATLRFANGRGTRQGAIVDVTWPRATVETAGTRAALGANPPNPGE